MRKYLLLLLVLLIQPLLLSGQEQPQLPKQMKKVDNVSDFKKGFYLLETKGKTTFDPLSGEVVKRLGSGFFFVHFSETTKSPLPENGTLYKVSPDWKLSPSLREVQIRDSIVLSIKSWESQKIRQENSFRILRQHKD